MNKTIFFGCSMRWGQGVVSSEDLVKFRDLIEELGYQLASKHQTQSGIIEQENKQATTYIHDRDYRWLLSSVAGVFEISNPSLGVGGEICDMLHEGKPVLCLYQGEEAGVSAYIRGKQGSELVKAEAECHQYHSMEEAKEIISKFLETHV